MSSAFGKRKDRSIYRGDLKRPKIYYITYYLMFPDGDTWHRQTPIVQNMDVEMKNMMVAYKNNPEWKPRIWALWKLGDVWWKDKMGVEHRMVVEKTKKNDVWGRGSKKGMGTIQQGVKLTDEDLKR